MIYSVIIKMLIITEKGLYLRTSKLADFTVVLIFLVFSALGILFSVKIYTDAEKNDFKEIKIASLGENMPLKPGFSFYAHGINFTVISVDLSGSASGISAYVTLKAEGNAKKLNRLGLAKSFTALIPEYKCTLRGPIIYENNN